MLYSVPAVNPVMSTDVASLAGVSVLILSPSLIVTLYPVNICEVGADHVTVNASVVLGSTASPVGGLGTTREQDTLIV